MPQKLFLQILAIGAFATSAYGHANNINGMASNGFMVGVTATVLAGFENDRGDKQRSKKAKADTETAPVDPLTAVTLNKQADAILDEMASVSGGTPSENDTISNGDRSTARVGISVYGK